MTTEPFPLIHHSTMLADLERLRCYKAAIEETVDPKSVVVDIGTGSGILSHYAALAGAEKVIGIEYFTSSFKIASEIVNNSPLLNQISFLNGRSYDVNLDCDPTILVTETIGPVGPEENIVEICYDFCSRHATIEYIIPMSMTLSAQPFYSKVLEKQFHKIISNYCVDDCHSFKIGPVLQKKFDALYSSMLLQGYITDAISIGKEIPIIDYNLGIDKTSEFKSEFNLLEHKDANGIYIFFEAKLTKNIRLKNHFTEKKLHWVPFYFKKPEHSHKVEFSYDSKTKRFSINWN